MTSIIDVRGIGPIPARRLGAAGVRTQEELLEMGCTPEARARLSRICAVSEETLLEWVNHADLTRLQGIRCEHVCLLVECGVDRLERLADREPGELSTALSEAGRAMRMERSVPTSAQGEAWVAEARTLPRVVTV